MSQLHFLLSSVALGALLSSTSACRSHEALAREHLEHEGFETLELTESAKPGGFSYRATRGETVCQGRIEVEKLAHGDRTINDEVTCRLRDGACSRGHVSYCMRLGKIYDEGHRDQLFNQEPDAKRALGFYTTACDSDDGPACNLVGLKYAEGQGAKADHVRAAQLFKRSCSLGHARGCFNLALGYHNGIGLAVDTAKAVELYRRACDGQVAAACYNLGVCYRDGTGTTQSAGRAAAAFGKACEARYLTGCVNLGVMRASADGVPKDLVSAKELFRIACNGGLEEGCEGLRRLADTR